LALLLAYHTKTGSLSEAEADLGVYTTAYKQSSDVCVLSKVSELCGHAGGSSVDVMFLQISRVQAVRVRWAYVKSVRMCEYPHLSAA
jgi:hypothetical protein